MLEHVRFVVDRFNSMMQEDGAELDVVRASSELVELRYAAASGAPCESCVLDADDLQALVSEALSARGVAVETVRVLR